MSLVFVLLSLCVGLLFSVMKRSALHKAFFNVIPHLYVLVQLKSVCFAFRSPVMIILSAEFLMLLSRVSINSRSWWNINSGYIS